MPATVHNKVYLVRKIKSDSPVNGISPNSPQWDAAEELSDFAYPWETGMPKASLTFKGMHDNKWFYWLFLVEDKNVNVFVDKNNKHEVLHGDRVEIFFSADELLSSYYCLEVDPRARVYDYHASYHRKFDDNWQWPSGHLLVDAQFNEAGYRVTGMISKESLEKLGLLRDGVMRCGLYRGKCMEINLENESMKWISWVNPETATPDFHVPSSFGTLTLE